MTLSSAVPRCRLRLGLVLRVSVRRQICVAVSACVQRFVCGVFFNRNRREAAIFAYRPSKQRLQREATELERWWSLGYPLFFYSRESLATDMLTRMTLYTTAQAPKKAKNTRYVPGSKTLKKIFFGKDHQQLNSIKFKSTHSSIVRRQRIFRFGDNFRV